MNETFLQDDSSVSVHEKSDSQPQQPHFDATAIASAQPVKPLPNAKKTLHSSIVNALRRFLSSTAAVGVAVVMLTLAMLSLGLAGIYPRVSAGKPEAANTTQEEPVQSETANGLVGSDQPPLIQPSTPRKITPPKIKTNVGNNQTKPVARKVGVIHGRSEDQ